METADSALLTWPSSIPCSPTLRCTRSPIRSIRLCSAPWEREVVATSAETIEFFLPSKQEKLPNDTPGHVPAFDFRYRGSSACRTDSRPPAKRSSFPPTLDRWPRPPATEARIPRASWLRIPKRERLSRLQDTQQGIRA